MNESAWQTAHRADLAQRLAALSDQPNGIVYERATDMHHIRILKRAGQIQFYFVAPASGALDGPMSRIELEHPFQLLAEYTQAAMLTLLWQPQPQRICMLGLAGGRLSLLFYHYFPDCRIDNVDIDPAVVPVATTYFGLTFDQRQTISIHDARDYLATLPADQVYEIMIMDAFGDASEQLVHLATVEFYQACQQRLTRGGVLCVNMLKSDPRFLPKLKTFLHSFRHVLAVEQKYGIVLFGTNQTNLNPSAIMRRAWQLQRTHTFEFPLVERAAALQPVSANPAYQNQALRDVPLLYDP